MDETTKQIHPDAETFFLYPERSGFLSYGRSAGL